MKLRHQAFFWLNNPGSIADRDQLLAGLRTLSAIPQKFIAACGHLWARVVVYDAEIV